MSAKNTIRKKHRILIISQWPEVQNAEFELIEKIKKTDCEITVVDYFGIDVCNGNNLNNEKLFRQFDFAIALHFTTPKLLNIPTYLWVANPLEYMYLHSNYRTVIFNKIRAYDDFLYNGSDILKNHIKHVIGSDWKYSGLHFYPSAAEHQLIPARTDRENNNRLFYCGINWERCIDKNEGRTGGLLTKLDEMGIADFYGPENFNNIRPWQGFHCYRGEIPFDGVSLLNTMRTYSAVLAVSSPAHNNSETSSSRVFEALAAGVAVISNENKHVSKIFGDTVYYYSGTTAEEQAKSIRLIIDKIRACPSEAADKITRAQNLMRSSLCFETSFKQIAAFAHSGTHTTPEISRQSLDIFLFEHQFNHNQDKSSFTNIPFIHEASLYLSRLSNIQIRVIVCCNTDLDLLGIPGNLSQNITWLTLNPSEYLTGDNWENARLGDKVAFLKQHVNADFCCFLTQYDFPQYDYFTKAIDWLATQGRANEMLIHIAGFYIDHLNSNPSIVRTEGLVCNSPSSTYSWSHKSLYEHELGTFIFSRNALSILKHETLSIFDVTLPVCILTQAITSSIRVHRSRYVLLRKQFSSFFSHYSEYVRVKNNGSWSLHYDLRSNYRNELNALIDIAHESEKAMSIVNAVNDETYLLKNQPLSIFDKAIFLLNTARRHIAIYGAGILGKQIYSLLKSMSTEKIVKVFIDGSAANNRFIIDSVPVEPPTWLILNKDELDGIYIASEAFYDEIYHHLETNKLSYLVCN